MGYTPQQWSDLDPSFPASAARFAYMEGGIKGNSDRLDVFETGTGSGRLSESSLKAAFGSADPITLASLPGRLYNIKAQNGEPYSQDSVTTHNGAQYAVWVNENRKPIIGKRILPHGDWVTFDLSTISGNPLATPTVDDLHNNYVVAVDSTGFLHVSGNHHDSALRYVRSTAAGDITAWTAPGMVGTEENSVTYPQFLRLPNQELLFVYRNGSSGNGDIFINAYSTSTKTWARRSQPFKGTAPVSPDESAYTNHLAVSDDGVLHIFYMWRTTNDVADTHDLGYIKSVDGGITFTDAAGTALTLPVTPSVTSTLFKTGYVQQINQSGADVDSLGRPHACWWLVLSNETKLVHYWHDGTAWHEDTEDSLGLSGIGTLDLARPAVFCHGVRTFVIFSREYDKQRKVWRCKDITPTSDGLARLPEFTLFNGDLGLYEPTFDTRAVRERNELHMLVTPIQPVITGVDPNYTKQWGGVLTLDLTKVNTAASTARIPVAEVERHWIGANELYLAAGTPSLSNTLGAPAWLMPDAQTAVISGAVFIPPGWRSFDVDLWWANAGTGTGAVVDQFRYVFRKAGNNMTGGEINLGNVTRTAGVQNITTVTTVATGITVMPNDQLWRFNYRRAGGDAADTVANDTAVFGFALRKTS